MQQHQRVLLLNYCKINLDQIDYICDTTKEKLVVSPGMHILRYGHFYQNQTDYVYLFAWDHKNEILNKRKILKSGFHMSIYKNRIVFTGGTGRFASVFKLVENKQSLNFFSKKKELNILNVTTIKII